ncbi:MAG: hypothetical protein AB8U93_00360 [Francisella endosymbiont of Hyalomma scupense]
MLKYDGVAFGSTIINQYNSKLVTTGCKKINDKGIFVIKMTLTNL